MKYYYHPFSPNCRKTTALINSLDLEVEFTVIDLPKGEQRSPDFLDINPNGMVPALEDDGTVVLESNTIAIYLAEKGGSPLWPADRGQQIEILQWMFWEQSHFMYACGTVFYQRLIKPMIGRTPDEGRAEEALAKFRRHTAVLDTHLEGWSYLLGDDLTLADWAIAGHLSFAEAINLPIDQFQNVAGWLKRLDENEAWKGSAPKMG